MRGLKVSAKTVRWSELLFYFCLAFMIPTAVLYGVFYVLSVQGGIYGLVFRKGRDTLLGVVVIAALATIITFACLKIMQYSQKKRVVR